MTKEEVIDILNKCLFWFVGEKCEIGKDEIRKILKFIEDQQKEIEEKRIIIFAGAEKVKELEKGNRSLMESRIKWKNRYYKEKAKNIVLDKICKSYQNEK